MPAHPRAGGRSQVEAYEVRQGQSEQRVEKLRLAAAADAEAGLVAAVALRTSGLAAESRKVQQCQINRITVVVVKRLVQPMSVFCDSSLNRGNPLAWDCLYTHVYGCTHVHTHMLHARLNLKLREQIDRACSHIFPLENHTRVMAPRIPVPGRVDTTQC